ncbi:MAG: hypothetical protein JWQ97_1077 [Phenylobacterium sp.]|nr:hypothetical protein [Phenylobacterium sp.]
MKKASEYRLHAQECRALAAAMDLDEQRTQLLEMAAHWENLASDRLALIERHPELAQDGEHEEERSWKKRAAADGDRSPS